MNYLVLCVFDLKNANREDYLSAYMDLAALGLKKIIKSGTGPDFRLPTTAVMGMFDGRSVDEVRSAFGKKVQDVFKARGLTAHFFLVASEDWACAGESM